MAISSTQCAQCTSYAMFRTFDPYVKCSALFLLASYSSSHPRRVQYIPSSSPSTHPLIHSVIPSTTELPISFLSCFTCCPCKSFLSSLLVSSLLSLSVFLSFPYLTNGWCSTPPASDPESPSGGNGCDEEETQCIFLCCTVNTNGKKRIRATESTQN